MARVRGEGAADRFSGHGCNRTRSSVGVWTLLHGAGVPILRESGWSILTRQSAGIADCGMDARMALERGCRVISHPIILSPNFPLPYFFEMFILFGLAFVD